MPINLCLVGSADRELDQLLRDCGVRVAALPAADLGTLAHATTTCLVFEIPKGTCEADSG